MCNVLSYSNLPNMRAVTESIFNSEDSYREYASGCWLITI